jgi:SAM-dependent methyltransferase
MNNNKNVRLTYPIAPVIPFSKKQLNHLNYIYEAITNKKLDFIFSKCFCGERKGEVIDNYDCYGLNIPTIICEKCFAIRSKYFLDKPSIKIFYTEGFYYPHPFTSGTSNKIGMDLDEYYKEEELKGKNILKFIKSHIDINNIENVIEIGCGAGGILINFDKIGKKVYGCDYGANLIKKAKKEIPKGYFKVGDINKFKNVKFDLVILSDVVEHLSNPNEFFQSIETYINYGKHVYINVPSFFGIGLRRWNCNIRQYFKLEHTFCHNLYSLNNLMGLHKYSLVRGDEFCRAIFVKTKKKKFNIDKKMKNKIKIFIFINKIKFLIFFKTKLYYLLNLIRYLKNFTLTGK